MSETFILKLIRSAIEAVEKITTGVTTACVVAVILNPLIGSNADSEFIATVAGICACSLALVTAGVKVVLDSMISRKEGGS